MSTEKQYNGSGGVVGEILAAEGKRGRGKGLRRALVTLAILAAAAVVVYARFGGESNGTPRYVTRAVEQDDITVTVTATGNLQPTTQVVVGSELSGTVKAVEADYNDRVEVGQILVRLDTTKLAAQILQSQASLTSAEAKVRLARATMGETAQALARLREAVRLSAAEAVSAKDLDAAAAAAERAEAEYQVAVAAVAQAEATLQLYRADLAKTEIRSPVNGIVLSRSVEPGQTVAASLQAPVLFTLAGDLAAMELHVDVDEADVGKVHRGQQATFVVDAHPERRYPAEIAEVRFGAKTTSGVVTYETLLTVDNADLSLRPGMTATAEIVVETVSGALLVPNAALRFTPKKEGMERKDKGGSMLGKLMPQPPRPNRTKEVGGAAKRQQRVWVLEDGLVRPVAVKVGQSDGTRTQILEGALSPGQEVITQEEGGS